MPGDALHESNPYGSPLAEAPAQHRGGGVEAVYDACFELRADDIVRFNRLHVRRTRAGRLALARSLLSLPLLLLFFVFISLPIGGEPGLFLIAVALAFPLGLLSWLLFWRAIRKSARTQVAALPPGPSRITLSEYGITDESVDMLTARRWRLVQRLLVGPDGAYFYVSPVMAVLVPARAFDGEARFAGFVAAARSLAKAAGTPLE